MYEIKLYGYNYDDRIIYHTVLNLLIEDDEFDEEEEDVFKFIYTINEEDVATFLTDNSIYKKFLTDNSIDIYKNKEILEDLIAGLFANILNGYSELKLPNSAKLINIFNQEID